MADSANTPEASEDTPTPEVTNTPEPPVDPPAAQEEDFDKDRALATIRAQRESEKQLKAQLAEAKAAQDELQKIKDAEKSELELAQQKAEEAEATALRTRKNLEDANLKVALNGKVADVDLAATALKERGVEFDDNGQPKDIAEAVESLLTDKPLLAVGTTPPPKAPDIDAGAGANNSPPPELTPEELEHANNAQLSPEQYAELKEVSTYEEWLAVHNKHTATT